MNQGIQKIISGARVAFDSEHGPQQGTVLGVLRDISNGQRFAAVEIVHELPGIVWQVPVEQLQVKAAA